MTEAVKKEDVGYVFNFGADLGNGRHFSVTGNFPISASCGMMSEEMDKILQVANRQQAKSASRGVEDEIERLELRLEDAIGDLVRIDGKNKEKGTLTASERQAREAAVVHIEKMKKDIDYKKDFLDKLKEEAK